MKSVCEFGAVGDGLTLNTAALQRAVDACSAAQEPLFFPAGVYLSGMLTLRSDTHLRLDPRAVLLGSGSRSDYPRPPAGSIYADEEFMDYCFLFAEGADNLSIEGGTIDGQGQCFPEYTLPRPMLLRFVRCRNIRIRACRLLRPASWVGQYRDCRTVFLSELEIVSRVNANGDGADFDCCQDVVVSDCVLNTGDDAFCLQASRPEGVCEEIVVANCVVETTHAVARIGTSSRGTIRNACFRGLTVKSAGCSGFKIQGGEGGVISDLLIQGVVMRDVVRPIFVTLSRHRFTRTSPPAEKLPLTSRIERLQIADILASYSPERGFVPDTGFVLIGSSELAIRDVCIHDVQYALNGGGEARKLAEVGEFGFARPEIDPFHERLPSYALFAKHVENLRVRNFSVRSGPDGRAACALSDCRRALFSDCGLPDEVLTLRAEDCRVDGN